MPRAFFALSIMDSYREDQMRNRDGGEKRTYVAVVGVGAEGVTDLLASRLLALKVK